MTRERSLVGGRFPRAGDHDQVYVVARRRAAKVPVAAAGAGMVGVRRGNRVIERMDERQRLTA